MRWIFWILFPLFAFSSPAVDQILSEMSLEEKIGQLFVAPACPLQEERHRSDWLDAIEKQHIGNAIVKQSDPETQIEFLNWLQNRAKWPLLVLADAEWGLGMRMSGTISFPRNMTLGAIQDLSLLERLGAEIAREARLAGIHMNLAPVIDINSNPKNPVIHNRSFGDDSKEVSERGAALIRSMEKGGIYTCPKHFPGHGDTDVDSHFGLPIIRRFSDELDPFKRAIEEGATAIMTAHILAPRFDPEVPATLSFSIMTSLLREELGFTGLLVTDALNMRALSDRFSPEEIALAAHAAGADLLLYGDHISFRVDALLREEIPRAYSALLQFYRNKPTQRLDESVRRILNAKEAMGLFDLRIVGNNPDLNTDEAIALKKTLFEEAVTQLGGDFAPIDENTGYVSIGSEKNDFLKEMFSNGPDADRVVVSIRGIKHNEKNFGLSSEEFALCQKLASNPDAIFCLFGSPYALSLFPKESKVLVGYEEDKMCQQAVLNILRGNRQAVGRLPISRL